MFSPSNQSKTGNQIRLEIAFFLSVALVLSGLLFHFYTIVMPYTYGDTGFLIEVILKMANGEAAMSHVLAQNAAEIRLASAELSVFCQEGLKAEDFATDPYDLFSLHAYVILFLVAPLAKLFGALTAISVLTALAFAVVPLIVYLYVRRCDGSMVLALLASLVSVAHPAWQISSTGQFYVDRLFLPFALLYVLFVHEYFSANHQRRDTNSRRYLIWAISIGVLGGLTSERNMLVVGIFSFAYAVLARTEFKKRFVMIAFALSCALYSFLYLRFFGGTPDNAHVQSALLHLPSVLNAINRPGIGEYLLFNSLLLVLPALLAPRIFLAMLPILALNCIVTMGGAEKNGWATHYHSHYYGFLLAAFLLALAQGTSPKGGAVLSTIFRRFITPTVAIITVVLSAAVSHYYPNRSVWLMLWDLYGRPPEQSSALAQKAAFDKLAAHVPIGEKVTATEWGMAAWYLRGNRATIFPVGFGLNDYLAIQANGRAPDFTIHSAVRYRGDAEAANECFASRIAKDYEEIAREGNRVLYKKRNQRSS